MNAELEKILCGYRERRVAVIGVGVSNMPLVRLLCAHGVIPTVCDLRRREALGETGDELEALGVELRLGEDYLRGLDFDLIFRTPGLLPTNSELSAAVERGAELTSEMELFFRVCPCTIIAVTGSDGKTTTTSLIAELLRAEGKTVHVGGNIGRPLLADSELMQPQDYAVVELSSFQLMSMCAAPHIAVVTNVSPNHLDMHTDMEEYTKAKMNVFLGQSASDVLVTNLDNEISASFAACAAGELRGFSCIKEPENGVCLKNGVIYDVSGGVRRELLREKDILLPGHHNVENYMAAAAAVRGIVSVQTLREVAAAFAGVEHRLELVREFRGCVFYNDSIASSPTRTIAGLRAVKKPIVLIAGGYDKNIPFDELGSEIVARVKRLVLTGDTAEKLFAAVQAAGGIETHLEPDFDSAVRLAASLAEPGDAVLFSPACSSFDKFRNFAERGERFKAIINSL